MQAHTHTHTPNTPSLTGYCGRRPQRLAGNAEMQRRGGSLPPIQRERRHRLRELVSGLLRRWSHRERPRCATTRLGHGHAWGCTDLGSAMLPAHPLLCEGPSQPTERLPLERPRQSGLSSAEGAGQSGKLAPDAGATRAARGQTPAGFSAASSTSGARYAEPPGSECCWESARCSFRKARDPATLGPQWCGLTLPLGG